MAALSLALLLPQLACPSLGTDPGVHARPGLNGTVQALNADAGGALFVGGQFHDTWTSPNVTSWDGASWVRLGSELGSTVRAFARYDGGQGSRMYAGGDFLGAVLGWNGTGWMSAPGGPEGGVHALAAFDDGGGEKLYAAGNFVTTGGAPIAYLARWDGVTWSAVGGAFDAMVRTLAVHDDGSGAALYAGGDFALAGGVAAARVARWDGSAWSPLGSGVDGAVRSLASFGGDLIAGGSFALAGDQPASRVARFDGAAWHALGSGASADVHALAVHDDGTGARLFAGGDFASAGGVACGAVGAWDGASWSSPASGVVGLVRSLAAWDGQLVAGGEFRLHDGITSVRIARWDGASWRALAEGIQDGSASAIAVLETPAGAITCVGGSFHEAGGRVVGQLATWDGARFAPLASCGGTAQPGVALLEPAELGAGPELLVGGSFTTIAGVPCANVARFDGTTFTPLGDGLSRAPTVLLVDGSGPGARVYAATNLPGFTFAGASASCVATWSGGAWEPFGTLLVNNVRALEFFDDGESRRLYAAGVLSPPTGFVSRSSATGWTSIATMTGLTADVLDLVTWDDGGGRALLACGRFSNVNGLPAQRVARFDGVSWSNVGFPGVPADTVACLTPFDDGSGRGRRLYAASTMGVSVREGAAWNLVAPNALTIAPWELTAIGSEPRQLWNFGTFESFSVGGVTTGTQGIGVLRACEELGTTYCHGDGSEGACPCGNASAIGARQGCAHSLGYGGALRASGRASLSQDTLVLDGSTMTNSSALYFQGLLHSAPVAFGDGIKCTSGPFVRLATKNNAAGASTYPVAGDASVSVRGQVLAPGTRHYQVRYRNAAVFCTSETFNTTNAVAIEWGA